MMASRLSTSLNLNLLILLSVNWQHSLPKPCDVTMSGVVTEISQSSLVQGGDVLYTVRIETEDADPSPKWAMTVEVTFDALEK